MKAIEYSTGELVKVGDVVEIKKLFSSVEGLVTSIYDPSKPSPPHGDNDYGVNIKLKDGSFLWGVPDKKTKLVRRA